jgi:CRISPR/Cas system-associated exonuclease Cas4 (RecB family)
MFYFCEYQYKLHYIDKIRPPVDDAMRRGSIVHNVLEKLFKDKLSKRDFLILFATSYLKQFPKDDFYYAGIKLLAKHYSFFKKFKPEGIEEDTIKSFDGFNFRAIADLLLKDWVLDWKTSARQLTSISEAYKRQLVTYCNIFNKTKAIIVNLNILGEKISVLKYKYNENDFEKVKEEITHLNSVEKYQPTGRKRGGCKPCSYNKWCIHFNRMERVMG